MGLFKWLVIKLAGALGQLPHQRVAPVQGHAVRRDPGHLHFAHRRPHGKPGSAPAPVLTRPFRVEFGEDTFFYWAEPKPEGGFKTVEFHPPTPELREEAVRHSLTPHTG